MLDEEEYRRLDHEEELERIMPEVCGCGMRQWFLVDTSIYGDDADGNRGVPMKTWECHNCGNEVEVLQGS